jgi:hypothetical protein
VGVPAGVAPSPLRRVVDRPRLLPRLGLRPPCWLNRRVMASRSLSAASSCCKICRRVTVSHGIDERVDLGGKVCCR